MGILGGLGSKLFEGRFYRGSYTRTTIGATNGDTRSLDYDSLQVYQD